MIQESAGRLLHVECDSSHLDVSFLSHRTALHCIASPLIDCACI